MGKHLISRIEKFAKLVDYQQFTKVVNVGKTKLWCKNQCSGLNNGEFVYDPSQFLIGYINGKPIEPIPAIQTGNETLFSTDFPSKNILPMIEFHQNPTYFYYRENDDFYHCWDIAGFYKGKVISKTNDNKQPSFQLFEPVFITLPAV